MNTYSCDENANRDVVYLMGKVLHTCVFYQMIEIVQTDSDAVDEVVVVLQAASRRWQRLEHQWEVRQGQSEVVPSVRDHYYIVVQQRH